jgi:putative iron-regulated protein
MTRILTLASLLLAGNPAAGPAPEDLPALKRQIVRHHAAVAHAMYAESERTAQVMRARIAEFLADPAPASLRRARESWTAARRLYGQTEVLRFCAGPIDDPHTGVETLVNAWPVDEAYIDSVRGDPATGIINAPERCPNLTATMLAVWNQRGGEANVSTGWHAIEFLLWGQDFDEAGPGSRPHTDFVAGAAPGAARRAEYLRAATDLLVEHLRAVRDAWAPGAANYRASFEADDPDRSLRKIITGMAVLSGFEMSGERMAVAYETRDQEEEHSCFSDTTHLDLEANQLGVAAVYRGRWGGLAGPGIRDLARALDVELTARLDGRIAASLAALRAIPPPFDRAVRAADASSPRRAVLAGIESLEDQAAALAALGATLGYEIALEPGG